ncbi:uncharacterized protein LOC144828268 [Lissotriton helveticus]
MEPSSEQDTSRMAFDHKPKCPVSPEDQMTPLLAPLLPRRTQTDCQGLARGAGDESTCLKKELLEPPGMSAERYRQMFRSLTFTKGANPLVIANQLHDWCSKWLKPELRSPADIVELIVVEQFIQILPVAAQEWLRLHRVASIDITVQLVEEYFRSSEPEDGRSVTKSPLQKKDTPDGGSGTVNSVKIPKKATPSDGNARMDDSPADDKPRVRGGRGYKTQRTAKSNGSDIERSETSPGTEECGFQYHKRTKNPFPENGSLGHLGDQTERPQSQIAKAKPCSPPVEASFANDQELCDENAARDGADEMAGCGSDVRLLISPEPYPCTYICSECGKNFKTNAYLNIHKRIHTGAKPHTCAECGKRFNQKTELVLHQRKHTGERPFKCVECEKSFIRNSDLIVHRRLHTGERPYKCTDCEEGFIRSSLLTMHQKRYHRGQKGFTCRECKETFTTSSLLTIHQEVHAVHRSYLCSLCGKAFNHKSQLIIHHRTHTGERLYACDQCRKGFHRRKALTLHQKTHLDTTNSETLGL